MSDESKIIGLKNVGLGSERAREDGANTLVWTDVDAGWWWGGMA